MLLVATLVLGLVPADSGRRSVEARFSAVAPVIDGTLEELWRTADSATGFSQLTPDWNSAATDTTVAYVLYDKQCIYVAFRCLASDAALVRARLSSVPDGIRLFFDTFEDRTSCYEFIVNASGTEQSYRLTQNGSWLEKWDGVWRSAAKVHDWGYAVEVAIPFKSLRYPPTKTTWGIDFGRYFVVRGEKSFWNRHAETGFRIEDMGQLRGIKAPPPGLHLELYPVALGRAGKTGSGAGWRDSLSAAAGLDLAWLPTPTASIQLTALPDFAQIEADPFQLNLTKYEPWLAERRPFFTEAQENFGSGLSSATMFYSRRIGKSLPDGSAVPVLGGAKYTDRVGRYQFGALAALTGRADYDCYGTPMSEPQSWYTVASVRSGVLANSEVGLLYAGKENERVHNRGLRADAALRFGDLTAEFVGAGSIRYDTLRGFESLTDTGGPDSLDWAAATGVSYKSSTLLAGASVRHIGALFGMNGPGYTTWRGQQVSANAGPVVYNRGPFRYASLPLYVDVNREWSDIDPTPNWGLSLNPYVTMQNRWGIGLWGGPLRSRYLDQDSVEHRYTGVNCGFNVATDESKPVSGAIVADCYTRTYNYNRGLLAPSADVYGSVMAQAGDRVQLSADAEIIAQFPEAGRAEWHRDATLVLRPRVDIALTPKMSFGLGNEIVDAAVGDGSRSLSYRLTGLYSYTFLPRSTVYFAWNVSLGEDHLTELVQVIKLRYLFVF